MQISSFWLAILTAFIWGCVPVLEKLGLAKISPMTGLFYRSLGVMIGVAILWFFLVKPEEIRNVDLRSAFLVLAGGFLASFVAQILFYTSLKGGDISRVVPISGSYPMISFLLGVMLFGEPVTMGKLAGVGFVILGIWFLR